MSVGLIFKIYFVWFVFLVIAGLVWINLGIDVWRLLKRRLKSSEQRFTPEAKTKMREFICKPGLNDELTGSTE